MKTILVVPIERGRGCFWSLEFVRVPVPVSGAIAGLVSLLLRRGSRVVGCALALLSLQACTLLSDFGAYTFEVAPLDVDASDAATEPDATTDAGALDVDASDAATEPDAITDAGALDVDASDAATEPDAITDAGALDVDASDAATEPECCGTFCAECSGGWYRCTNGGAYACQPFPCSSWGCP